MKLREFSFETSSYTIHMQNPIFALLKSENKQTDRIEYVICLIFGGVERRLSLNLNCQFFSSSRVGG